MATETAPPPVRLPTRLMSETGRQAKFADADTEIERVLKHQKNYYVVLKVRKDTEQGDIRRNYLKLQALLHPDKCKNSRAPDASAVVNQAYDTLTTLVKKTLYDAYVRDVDTDAPEGMNYADWEASMAQPVEIPKWVMKLLSIPGGRFIFLLIVLLVFLPLTLILILLLFVLWLVCLPFNCLARICCGAGPVEQQEGAAEAGGPTAAPETQSMGQQGPNNV